MVIRRRSVERTKTHRLRHPLLQPGKPHLDVYRYISQKPGSSWGQIKSVSSSGQPLTDLVDAGLVRSEGSRGRKVYYAVPENETGPGRDQVHIEVTVSVNAYGEYSAAAKVIDQRHTALDDFPRPVTTKTIKLSIPKPDEPFSKRLDVIDAGAVQIIPPTGASTGSEDVSTLTIEGDYSIIKP